MSWGPLDIPAHTRLRTLLLLPLCARVHGAYLDLQVVEEGVRHPRPPLRRQALGVTSAPGVRRRRTKHSIPCDTAVYPTMACVAHLPLLRRRGQELGEEVAERPHLGAGLRDLPLQLLDVWTAVPSQRMDRAAASQQCAPAAAAPCRPSPLLPWPAAWPSPPAQCAATPCWQLSCGASPPVVWSQTAGGGGTAESQTTQAPG